MLAATLAFSLMQVCVKFLSHLPFHQLILFRSVISLVLSLGWILHRGMNPLGNNRRLLVLRGVYGTVALSLLFLSIQKLPLASAATLSYLSPIFTALLAIFLLGERLKRVQYLFFAIAFGGVVLIRGFDSNVQGIYVLAAVIGAFFAGLAYNMVRKLKDSDHPVVVVFYFPLIATPVMGAWSLVEWVPPRGWDWPLLLAIGLLTQIGQVYMSKALQTEAAARITGVNFLGMAIALLFSVFLFRESYTAANIAGLLLVSLGVFLNIYVSRKP